MTEERLVTVEELVATTKRVLNIEGAKTFRHTIRVEKIGRNEPCPCNSGKKYKKCCGR